MTDQWFHQSAKAPNSEAIIAATAHQQVLTKPAGSLGRLEDIAIDFSGWQSTVNPQLDAIQICVFAGDHGVCQQGVSAFPQEVTAQMVFNFLAGGAAISVLAKQHGAQFQVINMGLVNPIDDAENLLNLALAPGTNDFTQDSAMSEQIMRNALAAGRDAVQTDTQLFIGGDMGIGNTTSASAIYSLVLNQAPEITVGPGTGIDAEGIKTKQQVLYQALNLHADNIDSPLDILAKVGGLEIAGLVGAYIGAAQAGVPILVDGFITTAAALLAERINPSCRAWMLFAHKSAEPAHTLALEELNAQPLLDLGLRLGEGSGSGVAVSLIQSALVLHNQMASFADAGVSTS